jgi:Ca-activated chloride channel family protein
VLPEIAACTVLLLALLAEQLHARRSRRVAGLAFGPTRKPAPWVWAAPFLRAAALAGLCWGLVTLLLMNPKVHKANVIPEAESRHLLLVLDVSPSMRLQDAGPTGKQSRMQRAADLLKSFFERVPIELYRVTVVATYTEAKPVVIDTTDLEVIHNILGDLPMSYAFKPGPTNLFAGLEEAVKVARPWRPRSTTLLLVSDGDTVPATGIPKLPASVAHVLVCGVGDPRAGKFIEGHQSRQDISTLRQVAVRLGGAYHNGNEKHLPSSLLQQIAQTGGQSTLEKLTRREYALIACGAGSTVLALLPLALHFLGTRWRPGVPRNKGNRESGIGSRESASAPRAQTSTSAPTPYSLSPTSYDTIGVISHPERR